MAAAAESFVERGLFGGAITCCIPANFYDVSNISSKQSGVWEYHLCVSEAISSSS
jgi:hypothetical protein